VIADLPDLEEVFDFELMDRVEGHARGSSSIVPAGKRSTSDPHCPMNFMAPDMARNSFIMA
jgi:hypothetical protein